MKNNIKSENLENIKILKEKFLDLKNFKADLVIIDPFYIANENLYKCELSLKNDFFPELKLLIQKALEIANNFIMILPNEIKIREIPELILNQPEYLR